MCSRHSCLSESKLLLGGVFLDDFAEYLCQDTDLVRIGFVGLGWSLDSGSVGEGFMLEVDDTLDDFFWIGDILKRKLDILVEYYHDVSFIKYLIHEGVL